MSDLDAASEKFESFRKDWENRKAAIETEQDARFQIINHMLRDVLGWPDRCVKTEPHVESGYIDYLMTESERNVFVVEAKRISSLLIDTKLAGQAAYG